MSHDTDDTQDDLNGTISRRGFLGAAALAGAAGLLGARCGGSDVAPGSAASDPEAIAAALKDNVYTRVLGVRPHIGAHETISSLSGTRMPPEVIQAMAEANDYFVDMGDLTKAAGEHIAAALGAEAALVTAGGYSSMLLAAAACLTGADREKIEALPHPTWPARECLVQKAHRFVYDHAYRAAGMTLVEAETRDEFVRKINKNTVMIAGLVAVEKQNVLRPPMPVKRATPSSSEVFMPEELIAIGKAHGVPVMIDMASDLPPRSNLTRFIKAGADLVGVSGGKAIRGPQSTGILMGRRDLVEAARAQNSPNNGIGRGMKVGKEEVIGLIVALDRYLALDEDALIAESNAKVRWLADQLQGIPGLNASYEINTVGYADVELTWDENVIPVSREAFKKRLKEGDPSIVYDGDTVRTIQLREGEEILVARRLRALFEEVARG